MSSTHIVSWNSEDCQMVQRNCLFRRSVAKWKTVVAEGRITAVETIMNDLVVELSTKSSRSCKAMEIDKVRFSH